MDRIPDTSDVLRRYPTRAEFGDESVITTATKQRRKVKALRDGEVVIGKDYDKFIAQNNLPVLFTIANRWKQSRCLSTGEWPDKMWCVHTMEYYLTLRRKEILTFAAAWVILEGL